LELLTRGFASLPFDSFALSLQKLLNSIIEHFKDEVNYYSDGHWFVCYLLLEKKAGIYVLFLDLKKTICVGLRLMISEITYILEIC